MFEFNYNKNICLNINSYKRSNKIKLNFFNQNSFLLKQKNVSKKNYISYYFKLNKNFYHCFSYFNKVYFNNFLKVINCLFENKSNFLFIDSNYKYVLPILKKVYGLKNLFLEKSFFFLSKYFLTLPNWLYLYKFFLKKYDVNFLVFLDYYEFKNFFNVFSSLNRPLMSIIPINFKNSCLDYYFYTTEKIIEINKIIIYNFLTNSYYYYFNIFNWKKKLFFLSNYKKLFNK